MRTGDGMASHADGKAAKRSWLDAVERIGNALPDPAFIFLFLILVLVIVSVMAAAAGWSAVNPVTSAPVVVQSLLSEANVARLLTDMPRTLTGFAPLGLMIVVMLGAAVAERSGLFTVIIGRAVAKAPRRWLTPSIFLIALFSHHAADAAYVVLIPLSAIIYAEAGRHPLVGIAVAYAGISGAFAGNVIPGQFDVLLLGITQAAAQTLAPDAPLNPLGNWWFTAALGLGLLPIAWFIADRILEPRLRRVPVDGEARALIEPVAGLSAAQRRGLGRAALAACFVFALFAALVFAPGYTPLIDETAHESARNTPFFEALIAGFFLLFLSCGWAYGAAAGSVKSHRDVVKMMAEGVRDIAPYIVLVFFAAHFIAMFQWSNLGPVIAVNGAAALKDIALPPALLLITLLLMSSVFDLLIGSASAKWTAFAPIVVPMLMLLGISPEMTTAAYRMGDSIFNIVTPIAANFVLVLIFCQRWVKGFGIGSLIAMMLPFSIANFFFGLFLVGTWVTFGIPVGPGAPVGYALPSS